MTVSYKTQRTITIQSALAKVQDGLAQRVGLTWEEWVIKALDEVCERQIHLIQLREQQEDEKFRSE